MRIFISAIFALVIASLTHAEPLSPRQGWHVLPTDKPYEQLIQDLKSAVKFHGMGVVTQAGPTKAAKNRGIIIPGNRVIGVFNNDFAVRTLATSTAAMIEAPIRFYVTQNPSGTATLSYKTPSFVFTPYMPEAGDTLRLIATELDQKFADIAQTATK